MDRVVARLWSVVSLALVMALLGACAPPGAPGSGGGGTPSGPIKIGVLAPTTGTTAASGTDMLNGWNLYWKVKGTKVAGRDVQTMHEDTGGDPNVALTKARQLVEQNGASMLV